MGKIVQNAKLRSLTLRHDGHLTESGDTILQWRMCAEQGSQPSAANQGFDDAQSCGCGRKCGRRDALIVRAQLLEGADQAVWLANHASTSLIGGILPSPGKEQLEHQRCKRRQNHHGNCGEGASASFPVIVPLTPVTAE